MDKNKKNAIRPGGSFSMEERREIINDYLSGNTTKTVIWKKYTGQNEEHGQLLRWMRQLGLNPEVRPSVKPAKKSSTLPVEPFLAVKEKEKEQSSEELKMRIKELEKQLETARLKAEGYELMIEIAEKELNIPIRKKSATK